MIALQEFELNTRRIHEFSRDSFSLSPHIVEKLVKELSGKGYRVMKSSAYFMGVPQTITLVKETTSPLVHKFSSQAKEDLNFIANSLGIGNLFE